MKQFSIPLLLVLAIVAGVAINGWRGAGRAVNATAVELTTLSNKLAETTVKLAEQGAAAETLRVQLGLHKSDLVAASNHVAALSGQIKEATARTRELEGELQQRTGTAEDLKRSHAHLESRLKDAQAQITAGQSALESARIQSAEIAMQLESANAALNASEADRAALWAQLHDSSTLRAQIRVVNASAPGLPKSPDPLERGGQLLVQDLPHAGLKPKQPLVMNPDGSVTVVSSPKKRPASP